MQKVRPIRAITFDCYGTLIDWEAGLWSAAQRPLKKVGLNVTRARFYEAWEPIQFAMIQGPYKRYRKVLTDSFRAAVEALGGKPVSLEDAAAFAGSMADWEPFPDVVPALAKLSALYVLAPISNTDDDFLAASARRMGNPFHHLFTAQQAKAYKPSTKPFQLALKKLGCDPAEVLHVAFGYRYDLGPARESGMRTAWLNRSSESLPAGFEADFQLDAMSGLVSIATRVC
ncbi:MAG: haloacid dehalogenase type II [Candidatus Wallbacteria bacterium]|nr:haloacid dehalogenase type II [Candidatus Wallbacteria bacterium]